VVYDRYDEIGGLLTFGIPEFKMEKWVMTRRREVLEGMGVEFRLNTDIGKDVSMQSLLDEYDAVFHGHGHLYLHEGRLPRRGPAWRAGSAALPDSNVRKCLELTRPDEIYQDMKGLRVVVLVAATPPWTATAPASARRASVICAYRRDEKNMPGSKRESQRQGRRRAVSVEPPAGRDRRQWKSRGRQTRYHRTRPPDARGRRTPVVVPGSEEIVPADRVIVASASPNPQHGSPITTSQPTPAPRDRQGQQHAFQTANPKIFAGGDMVRAPTCGDRGVGSREAAKGILAYLDLL